MMAEETTTDTGVSGMLAQGAALKETGIANHDLYPGRQQKEPEKTVEQTADSKAQWDKDKQLADQTRALQTYAEQNKELSQALQAVTEEVTKLKQAQPVEPPKPSARESVVEEIKGLPIPDEDDPDAQKAYAEKVRDLLVKTASMPPETQDNTEVMGQIQTLAQQLQGVVQRLDAAESDRVRDAYLDQLDSKYDPRFRADAWQAVTEEFSEMDQKDITDAMLKKALELKYRELDLKYKGQLETEEEVEYRAEIPADPGTGGSLAGALPKGPVAFNDLFHNSKDPADIIRDLSGG